MLGLGFQVLGLGFRVYRFTLSLSPEDLKSSARFQSRNPKPSRIMTNIDQLSRLKASNDSEESLKRIPGIGGLNVRVDSTLNRVLYQLSLANLLGASSFSLDLLRKLYLGIQNPTVLRVRPSN